ncbi:MAG: TRAP transporter substrate-binding protein [Alphaproteobacteria bacterium]|nr:TRAP transporter substrate-binding protein [Alphaproteobacteria bacterium]MCB9928673.1 TRAP transporter substrate-binding protein [Alphaproteobacteria bacterium]
MRPILTASLAAIASVAIAATGQAATMLKLQTAMAAGSFTLNYLNEVWVPKLEAMTYGNLKMEILPSKAVVPHRETPGAVAAGILQGDLNAIAYFAGKDQGFALMGDLIAGYDTVEQMQMFCRFGGGKEVLQKLYEKFYPGKIHVIGCGPFSKEALVSSIPIRGVADFKGVKIRSPEGLAAEVFARVGAVPTAIPFPEVYTALDKGIVDAADASSYTNNQSLGFHKLAKYPIFPGIHSMAVIQFVVNQKVWDKIGPEGQAALETWYYAAWTDMSRASDVEDHKIAAQDSASGTGIEVIDWSTEERAKFRKIAQQAWADASTKSDLAKAAYDAHVKFMKEYGLLD